VNCNGLVEVANKKANNRIAWCPGIAGSIDYGVVVEEGYTADAAIPIDLLFDASIGDKHNPNLLPGNIPGEHYVHLENISDKSSEDESDDEEVVAAAGVMAMFGCAAQSVPVAPVATGTVGPS